MAFEAAFEHARQAINQQQNLDVLEWAAAAMTCATRFRTQGITDHRVQTAGALGRYLNPAPVETALTTAFREPSWNGDPAGATRARNALAFLTHTAAETADGPTQTILRAYSVTLLGRETSPIDEAVHHWADAVVLIRPAIGPSADAMIIDRYIGLLRTADTLASQITARPDVAGTIERWRSAVQREAENWAKQLPQTAHVPPRAETARHYRSLASAAVGVRRALAEERSPATALLAIARTLPMTNLMATHALGMTPSKTTTRLVDLGALLAQTPQAIRDREPSPTVRSAPTPTPTLRSETSEPKPAASAVPRVPQPEPPAADPTLRLSAQEELELGRRMDAGTIARAAIDGSPEARKIVGATSNADLEKLISSGAQARAQLLASVYLIPPHIERQRGFAYSDDRVQAIHEVLAKQIDTWRPERAKWSTWAYKLAHYAYLQLLKQELSDPTIPADQHNFAAFSASEPTVEDQVMHNTQRLAVQELVSHLPEHQARVITLRLGFDGQPRTLDEVGQLINRSPTTVTRTFNQGIATLQRIAADTLAAPQPHPRAATKTAAANTPPTAETPIETIRRTAHPTAREQGRQTQHPVPSRLAPEL